MWGVLKAYEKWVQDEYDRGVIFYPWFVIKTS